MKGGQSKEVGSRVSQSEGVEERREASAREGWKGGVLEERRFCRTTSKWPRAVKSDWGGLHAEEKCGGEATDGDVSAADGVK